MGFVTFVTQQQQTAFLGRQQEHQAHHHRQCGFVDFGGRNVGQQGSLSIQVGFVQGLDQDFHGPADLFAERLGDFVLMLQGTIEQGRQSFRLVDEETADA